MNHKMNVNPWRSIWTNPRKTIREIVNICPKKGFYIISVLFSFQYLLNLAQSFSLGFYFQPIVIVIGSAILSTFVGLLLFHLSSYSLYWTGKIFKGVATITHIRASVAWSSLPYAINIIMWFLFLLTTTNPTFVQAGRSISFLFVNLISIIVAIWSMVLLVQTIKEVQEFSYAKAIGNYILGMILYFFFLFSIYYALFFSSYLAAIYLINLTA